MKSITIALAAFGLKAAAGQAVADYFPECSVDCVTNVLYTATSCAEGDYVCLCLHSNQYAIYAAAEQCAIDACGYDVAQSQVLPAAKPFCAAVNVAYSSTDTEPLPVDTAFNDYKTRRTQAGTTVAATTTATPAPTSGASDDIALADYFPACAVDCIDDVVYTATTCEEGDLVCACLHGNQYKIYAAAEQCAIDACGYDVAQQQVLPAAKPYCAAVNAQYSSTATEPIPVDTAFEDYKSRRTQTTAVTSATPVPTMKVDPSQYFPECAVKCITDVVFTATDCAQGDYACACLHSNQYAIYAASEQCVIDACGYDVAQQSALPAAKTYCAAVNEEYLATATVPIRVDTAFEDYKTRRTQATTTTAPIGSAAQTSPSGSVTVSEGTGYTVIVSGTLTITVPCTTSTKGSHGGLATDVATVTQSDGQTVVISGTHTVTLPCTKCQGHESKPTDAVHTGNPGDYTVIVSGTVTMTVPCSTEAQGSHPTGPDSNNGHGSGSSGSGSGSGSNGSGSGANPTTMAVQASSGSPSHDSTSTSTPEVVVNGAVKFGSVGIGAVVAIGVIMAI